MPQPCERTLPQPSLLITMAPPDTVVTALMTALRDPEIPERETLLNGRTEAVRSEVLFEARVSDNLRQ
jgi:hypothetical protein